MTQDELRQLFSELLEVDDLTSEDNFFDLGGSSVLALRLLLELDKRSGVTLSLIDVLRNPTAESLARCMAQAQTNSPA
ncbi:MAG TPA: phosphopantetheine-binding protein [Jatrophihabitans sp.]|jgi:aryl carrier-like protein|nr:phosphopantetheine-binding protein [Jatrophihabitans sp.]